MMVHKEEYPVIPEIKAQLLLKKQLPSLEYHSLLLLNHFSSVWLYETP